MDPCVAVDGKADCQGVKQFSELSLPDLQLAVFAVLILARLRAEEDPAAEGDELVPDHSERSRALVASLTHRRN
jgi:hypothetical protein